MDIIPGLNKLLEIAASGLGAVAGPFLAPWKARREGQARTAEASAESPPYLFPRLWQFPQATLPRGSILQSGAGAWQFLQLLRTRMPEERQSGSGPAWSTP